MNRWGNMKKKIYIVIGLTIILSIIFTSAYIMAISPSSILTDSGWDTDYGNSSSSWDRGSSWISGSDYSNHDYSYNDYNYGSRRTSSNSSYNFNIRCIL